MLECSGFVLILVLEMGKGKTSERENKGWKILHFLSILKKCRSIFQYVRRLKLILSCPKNASLISPKSLCLDTGLILPQGRKVFKRNLNIHMLVNDYFWTLLVQLLCSHFLCPLSMCDYISFNTGGLCGPKPGFFSNNKCLTSFSFLQLYLLHFPGLHMGIQIYHLFKLGNSFQITFCGYFIFINDHEAKRRILGKEGSEINKNISRVEKRIKIFVERHWQVNKRQT